MKTKKVLSVERVYRNENYSDKNGKIRHTQYLTFSEFNLLRGALRDEKLIQITLKVAELSIDQYKIEFGK